MKNECLFHLIQEAIIIARSNEFGALGYAELSLPSPRSS